jgi:alpha-tubulin suppressor-like RCC1 family protein
VKLTLASLLGLVLFAESYASAQVCTQQSPGIARIDTNGVTVTINIATGSVPKVNGVSCGFTATSIDVVGVTGKDTVTLNYVPPTMPVSMSLGAGTNNITVYATNSADTVVCGAAALDRDGDGTDDLDFGTTTISLLTINGRGGDDVLDCSGATYKVSLSGGDGNDTLDGGSLNDTLTGSTGQDTLDGHAGNDTLNGNEDNDTIIGGAGNDTLKTLKTFDGNDHYVGGTGSDNLAYGARTTSVVIGGAGSEDLIDDDVEILKGGSADDTLDFASAALAHNLFGGAGNDILRGGTGNDKLYGEAGSDQLFPGGGRDVAIEGGDGNDTIAPTLDANIETILCGAGIDHITSNTEDTFKDCETADPGIPAVLQIATGYTHSCAILLDGSVKCWGANDYGQLGLGDITSRGYQPGQMGAALPTVNLGTGRTAVAIAPGHTYTCALLDNATVKCWGAGSALGLGDLANRGDDPGEMGDALPAVSLGTGRTATAIAAGGHTCAILDNAQLKCWGDNSFGELGLANGTTSTRGDGPNEMGNSLPAVNLGAGRSAVSIAVNDQTSCAVLDNGTAKCWGNGSLGSLGQGNQTTYGVAVGSMGDNLPPIDLGTGRTAIAIGAGLQFNCALLDDASVKCWGLAYRGQLGLGDIVDRGDQPGEMGDALPAVSLGTGRTAMTLAVGYESSCVVLDNDSLKCWGYNGDGQLGLGNTAVRGDGGGEMGDALPPVALGTGRTAIAVAVGGSHACAQLDDSTAKCWGAFEAIGAGDTNSRGDGANEMGDKLPTVDLGVAGFAPLSLGPVNDAEQADDDVSGCSASRGGPTWLVIVLVLVVIPSARRRSARRTRARA